MEVFSKVVELLTQYSGKSLKEVEEDYNFVKDGLLDSFSLICFITDVEEEFQINFTPDELTSPSMQTIGGFVLAVTQKMVEAND